GRRRYLNPVIMPADSFRCEKFGLLGRSKRRQFFGKEGQRQTLRQGTRWIKFRYEFEFTGLWVPLEVRSGLICCPYFCGLSPFAGHGLIRVLLVLLAPCAVVAPDETLS